MRFGRKIRHLEFGTKVRVAIIALATGLVVLLIVNLPLGDKRVDENVTSLYSVEDPQFRRTMGAILGPGLLAGNRVQELVNGEQIFPAMLEAIRGARKTVTFETYIWWGGAIGAEFTRALIERARAGVKVHVLFDALGSFKLDRKLVNEMKEAGIQVEKYNAPSWDNLALMNNRTHRKILVVDGRIGFTGGAGIADDWDGNAQDKKHWRDTHYRIEGPAVAQMQGAFMENWIDTTGNVLHGEDYFPEIARAGEHVAQFFVSSPGGGSESMQLMYVLSIAAAAKTIRLSAAYFLPDKVDLRAFIDALKRGVKVQIIVPGPETDASIVRRASRSRWGELLRAGAEIYEFQPTMYHCKVMIVDDLWVSVGSTNFDSRSFSVNDEANLNVLHREFAKAQIGVFDDDLKHSRRISLDEWQNRPLLEKAWEHVLALFSPEL